MCQLMAVGVVFERRACRMCRVVSFCVYVMSCVVLCVGVL